MSLELDLANAKPETLRQFVVSVTGLACVDFAQGGKQYARTGDELVRRFCCTWRGFHKQLASTIYNKVIHSLECARNDYG